MAAAPVPAGIRVVPADRVLPDMTPGQWAWTCASRACKQRPAGQFHGLAGYPTRDDALHAATTHLTKTKRTP